MLDALGDDGTGHGPCLGDYPHIGADANGFYVTTNEYAFFPNFVYMGAQVYAFSKAALASGTSSVAMTQFDTRNSGVGGHPGFTLWPAQSSANQFNMDNGGTRSGRGVMAFTATGDSTNPSAAYAPIDAIVGVGPWNIVDGGLGAAQADGFTSYKSQVGNPPRTRWGDYGAAAVDGNSIWIASEYVASTCTYTDWGGPFFAGGTGHNLLGTCAGASHGPGPRSALGNWSTRLSKLNP